MTILAIVNASKEGQIESKMMKSRQMEEIREARKQEADARYKQRIAKMVSTYGRSHYAEYHSADCWNRRRLRIRYERRGREHLTPILAKDL